MTTLYIHLQEGFEGDTVIIDVNGTEVFREDEVRTKLLLGYAAIIDVPVDRTPAQVVITLPQKRLAQTISVPVVEDTYLGVSLQDGEIIHFVSSQPFGYG